MIDNLGIDAVIHCGDIGQESVFDMLAGRRVYAVWGNTDVSDAMAERYAAGLDIIVQDGPMNLTLSGRTITICHGHEQQFTSIESSAPVDLLLHGHTHRRRSERIGDMMILNPGALHRASTRTFATIDLKTLEATFHTVE